MTKKDSIFTLTKTFRFEAAHRIAKGYKGKCKHIHGHSWNGKLTVECNSTDNYGMGVDFGVIKQFLTQIEDYFDHKLILYKQDSQLIDLCQQQGWEVVVFDDDNPTSERIARYIYEQAVDYFMQQQIDCKVASVTMCETCTSSCVWFG
tara:strand:+ start:611 stop:1054 length:444 start_codon:yes stop_codon:yes gene_type:complete